MEGRVDTEASSNKVFQQHIHVFRGVAIILIVCAHTVPSLNWSANPKLGRFIDALANQASIFFFFIAGYLFQHLSGRFKYGKYLFQKLKTVIIPYLIVSIPALFIFTKLAERNEIWPWFYTLPIWKQVVLFIVTGKHMAPLWFVPTITLLYLAAPLLLKIDRSFPILYWMIIPLLALSTSIGRDTFTVPFGTALYLLPIYLLGMLFSREREHAELLVSKFWIPLCLLTFIGLYGYTLGWSQPPYFQMIAKAPATLLITFALLRWHYVFGKRLDYIAHVSFGIFFVHAYFISAIKVATVYLIHNRIYKGDGYADMPGNLLVFIFYAGGVLMFSVCVIWLAQKVLRKKSRMIIGA